MSRTTSDREVPQAKTSAWRRSLGATLLGVLLAVNLGGPAPVQAQDDDIGGQLNDSGGGGSRSSRSGSTGGSRGNSRSRSSGVDQSNDTRTGTGSDTGSSRRRATESQRDREKNSKPGSKATPGPGAPGSGTGGKKLESAKGKAAPAAKSSGGGEARAATNVEFKMKANPSTNLLYIEGLGAEPTLNIQAVEGKEFITRIGLQNPRGSNFKNFMVSLKYDPSVLSPVGLDDSDITSLVRDEPLAQVDSRRGIITFMGDLSTSHTDPMLTLFKVQWKALAPTGDSSITFLNSTSHRTFVKSEDGDNVLHDRDDDGQVEASEKAGLVDASVTVLPSVETARTLTEEEGSFSSIAMAHNISEGTAEGGILLELRTRKPYVRVGEEFLVDVLYTNPRRAELDTIKLLLRFDPQVLQVVDYDEDNWVTRGVNIYDGEYHDDLPFDFHRRNMADNDRGVIDYDMGFAGRVRIPAKGVIATIRMRAVAPSPNTPIVFVTNEADTEGEQRQTQVTFLGFNLIGTPGARASSMRDAALSISAM